MTKTGHFLAIFLLSAFYCSCVNVTLNLASSPGDPDAQYINQILYHIDGLGCRKFSPKPNCRILRVVDGKKDVSSRSNDEFTGAILYPESGPGKLLHLFIAGPNGNSHEYLCKEGDEWKVIEARLYRDKLDAYHASASPSKSADKPPKKKRSAALVPSIFSCFFLPTLVYAAVFY